MVAGQAAVPGHSIAVHAYQALGLAHATPLGDMVQDRHHGRLGQMGTVQGCALAFGEPGLAGMAVEEAILPLLAVPVADD
jgi:hypothetical protein